MAEKGIDYRVEYGNFVLFGHDCGFGCRQTNNAPDDRTFQVSVVTCRRAPLHGGIPVDTRGSASRMARLSPLGARFAPCGGAGWKLGFQFYRKKFTPANETTVVVSLDASMGYSGSVRFTFKGNKDFSYKETQYGIFYCYD